MIPPLVLLLQPDPSSPQRLLVSWSAPGERPDGGLGRRPDPVPDGALLLFWPTRFGWTSESQALADAVRERDGAVFPLATVTARLGLRAAGGLRGLVSLLAPDLEDAVDPSLVARRLVEGLADRLTEVMDDPDASAAAGTASGAADGLAFASALAAAESETGPPRPRAAVRFALEDLPAGPGVYTFLSADDRPLYVGKAKSLRARVPRHFARNPAEPAKSEALARDAARIRCEPAGSELEALVREQLVLFRDRPPLNTQERAHPRPRGRWRQAEVLLVLPSARERRVEICLVAGDGRFHWESAPRRARVPRDLWRRLGGFLRGEPEGWAPGWPGEPLDSGERCQLAEVALSWLARHGDTVTRIDLTVETYGRHLQGRLRLLLARDPGAGRTEAR